jgi:hypothetical protein
MHARTNICSVRTREQIAGVTEAIGGARATDAYQQRPF